uniref:von Willebrand factor A domain containing 5B2 n=1 Tax=Pavo cristatus TaxID=9049 RepID=A0A8C9F1U7_PAVCR
MPGLYVLSSWEALPLKSSRVKACANGYVLSITAQLLYTNPHEEPVEGVFIYPLEESELVAGFEAVVGSRRVTFQVQSRHRAQECCLECGSSLGQPRRCASGHLVLDEDTERSTFVIITGALGPAESLAVTLSTARELPTLPGGALHLILPPVLVPRVAAAPERESEPGSLCDDSPTSCFGGPGARSQPVPTAPAESSDVFRGQPYNPFPYEFAFELLVKGPCLLAGLESPTHALRADADPWASSATTTCVTLAERHRYDRNVEIILYPCEPHQPHLVMEEGTMTYPEYEAHIRSRRDYVRIARRDGSGERQVAFVQKRFHKDIFHNPVLMLNFCPEAEAAPGDLQSVTREVLFLIDCSGAMSTLLVALKSLPPGTLLNMATFGVDLQPLFPSSRLCSNETLQRACCHLGELQVAAGSPNLLAALSWALAQPLHHGYPRQLFLFTAAAAVGDVGRILQLVRRQASTVRCFSFGMGPRACRRLLTAIAKLTHGRAEFLDLAERLQPKLIKALKKAMEPAVSDITIDWYVPDSTEALLSPTEIAALYPGDRLISYCTLYSIARFRDQRPVVRQGGYSRRGSAVPSQEEVPTPGGTRLSRSSRDTSVEISAIGTEESERSADLTSGGDIWKRIYQPSYIQEQYVLTHCSVSTERSQGLLSRSSTSSESTGSRDVAPDSVSAAPDTTSQQGQKSLSLCESSTKSAPLPSAPAAIKVPVSLSSEELARQQKVLARAALAGRSFSSPHGELDARRLCRALEKVSQKRNQSVEGQLDQLGPRTPRLQRSIGESNNLLSPTHLDWDMLVEPSYLFSAVVPEAKEPGQADPCLPLRCHVVIHGLHAGQPVSWEVTASLEALLQPRDGVGSEEPPRQAATGGEKPLHGLAARSVIQDSEKAAQREAELEQGFARRFRLKAMQTSKACNVPSLYTCVVPVDGATRVVLPTAPQVWSTGRAGGTGWGWGIEHGMRQAGIGALQPHVWVGWEAQWSSPILVAVGPGLTLRPQCLSPESECSSTAASHDYLPLVQLQQARGPFQLTETFSEVVQIPLDRLRRASPYASHRASLSPTSPVAKSSPGAGPCTEGEEPVAALEPGSPRSHSTCSEVPSAAVWAQADSGHGSESDTAPHSAAPSEAGWQDVGLEDLESASWATAVALAWLEHRCAGFFDEWELVAAKADAWLQAQQLPEGLDVSCLKGAARHLFLLLRHWDENITLNMLCYNPNNV